MNQDWERWGRDIRNIVQNAIDSQDFRRLNDTIANTVNDAVFQFKESVRQTGEGFRQAGADFGKSRPDFRWDGQEYSRPAVSYTHLEWGIDLHWVRIDPTLRYKQGNLLFLQFVRR